MRDAGSVVVSGQGPVGVVLVGVGLVGVVLVGVVLEEVGEVDAVQLVESLGSVGRELVVGVHGTREPVASDVNVTRGQLGVRVGVVDACGRRPVGVDALDDVA